MSAPVPLLIGAFSRAENGAIMLFTGEEVKGLARIISHEDTRERERTKTQRHQKKSGRL